MYLLLWRRSSTSNYICTQIEKYSKIIHSLCEREKLLSKLECKMETIVNSMHSLLFANFKRSFLELCKIMFLAGGLD